MTDVMQRCVPVTTGALEPDLRVNYQFGLVLGVDEFEQEGLYLRTRDERAARSLHGFGTASGLHVSADRPAAAPADVEVQVAPGIAVDQYGRPVVIPEAQCARLGAWLASELRAAAAEGRSSPLTEHQRPSGDVTIHVVVEHGSCPDALVPLPGNPCGADDDVMAPSRIRDSWHLGFRWVPPAMAHWDGDRALADLLLAVELTDGSPLQSDELVLAEHIRALAPGTAAPTAPLPATPVLPRAGARAALDRLVTVWLTEVRPQLVPDLLAPDDDEAAILLSSVTFVPAAPFDLDAPAITAWSAPDDEGRPYLAPTQLIQELVGLGGGAATVVTTPAPAPRPLVELASLDEVGGAASRRLLLWSHLDDVLLLPDEVQVRRDGAAPVAFKVEPGPAPGTYLLAPPGRTRLRDGELLEVVLDVAALRVAAGGGAGELALQDWLDRRRLDLVDRVGDRVSLRHVVAPTPPEPTTPPDPRPTPVRQVATATGGVTAEEEEAVVELWWHVDKVGEIDEERVKELAVDAVRILAEVEGETTPVEIPFEVRAVQHNVFDLVLDRATWMRRARRSAYLRVLVRLDGVGLSEFGGSVAEYARELGVVVEDADEEGALLTLWVRMPRAVAR